MARLRAFDFHGECCAGWIVVGTNQTQVRTHDAWQSSRQRQSSLVDFAGCRAKQRRHAATELKIAATDRKRWPKGSLLWVLAPSGLQSPCCHLASALLSVSRRCAGQDIPFSSSNFAHCTLVWTGHTATSCASVSNDATRCSSW